MSSIGVVDYGMGNLHSLGKALERVAPDQRIVISYRPEELLRCDRLILPGVGGVRACVEELRRLDLNEAVLEAARRMPVLGICLGMQVLLEWSEENEGVSALGLFPGRVVRFADPEAGATTRLKVPHMGWNRIRQTSEHPVWAGVAEDSWFYFVHSYHAAPADPRHVLGITDYGCRFTSAMARENIVAFQCHPEKSQGPGMQVLSNFVTWNP